MKLATHLHLVSMLRKVELYLHSTMHIYGVVQGQLYYFMYSSYVIDSFREAQVPAGKFGEIFCVSVHVGVRIQRTVTVRCVRIVT